MKLYMIVFGTAGAEGAQVRSYVDGPKSKLAHYDADGFQIVKETNSCWFLDEYPEGMPKQYRKSEEYKMVNNSHAIYMYGLDAKKLIAEWNRASKA